MRFIREITVAIAALGAFAGCATAPSRPFTEEIVRRPGSIEPTARRQTALSPDGTKIFYNHRVDGRSEIWKQTGIDGTPEKFLADEHLSLAIDEMSPDGLSLAVLTTDAQGFDNGLQLRATNAPIELEVEPLTKGRQVQGAWFDNAASTLTYVVTSSTEQRSWFMQMNLADHKKKELFSTEGLVQELDCWGDGVFLFRREGAGGAAELLVWLGEETGAVAFKPTWLAQAKDIRFADKPDHFLMLKTDEDGINRVYKADETGMERVTDLNVNIEQFVIDHRRFRLYATSRSEGEMKIDALDAKSFLPYSLTLPNHLDETPIDRTSRYGRFIALSAKDGVYVYDWKESKLSKWLVP